MSAEHPPPYAPPPPAQGFPGTAPYQAPPSSYYYHSPRPPSTPTGYSGPFYDKAYGGPPKHTVYVVEPNEGAAYAGSGGGALRSLLSACSGLLCCCCLCDLLTRHL